MAWSETDVMYFADNASGSFVLWPYGQNDVTNNRFVGPISVVMLPVRDRHRQPQVDNTERFNELIECKVLGLEQAYTGTLSLGGADISYAYGYRYVISFSLHGSDMWARLFLTSQDRFPYFNGNS